MDRDKLIYTVVGGAVSGLVGGFVTRLILKKRRAKSLTGSEKTFLEETRIFADKARDFCDTTDSNARQKIVHDMKNLEAKALNKRAKVMMKALLRQVEYIVSRIVKADDEVSKSEKYFEKLLQDFQGKIQKTASNVENGE